jgi:hypothetical protein
MKRLTTHAVAGALLIGSAFFVDTARAQGTSADTALANNARSRVTDSLRIESARKQGIRKTVVTRLATRADSLLAAHLKSAAPVPVPLPAAPTASFAVVCAQYQCAFNAGASSGARITLTWDCGALPNCASTASAFSFSYPHEGSRTATLTVRDSLGRTDTLRKSFNVPGIPLPPPDTGVAERRRRSSSLRSIRVAVRRDAAGGRRERDAVQHRSARAS